MSIKFLKDYGFLVRDVKVSNPEEWGGRKSINAQMWYPRKDTVRIAFFAGERKIAYFDFNVWDRDTNWDWCKKWLWEAFPENGIDMKWMYEHGYHPYEDEGLNT